MAEPGNQNNRDPIPSSASEWRELAKVQFALGRWNEAAQSIKWSLDIDPGSAEAWCNLGAAQHKLRQVALAEKSSWRALSLDPQYRAAVVNLSFLLTQRGAPAEGAQLIRNFFASEPPCGAS